MGMSDHADIRHSAASIALDQLNKYGDLEVDESDSEPGSVESSTLWEPSNLSDSTTTVGSLGDVEDALPLGYQPYIRPVSPEINPWHETVENYYSLPEKKVPTTKFLRFPIPVLELLQCIPDRLEKMDNTEHLEPNDCDDLCEEYELIDKAEATPDFVDRDGEIVEEIPRVDFLSHCRSSFPNHHLLTRLAPFILSIFKRNSSSSVCRVETHCINQALGIASTVQKAISGNEYWGNTFNTYILALQRNPVEHNWSEQWLNAQFRKLTAPWEFGDGRPPPRQQPWLGYFGGHGGFNNGSQSGNQARSSNGYGWHQGHPRPPEFSEDSTMTNVRHSPLDMIWHLPLGNFARSLGYTPLTPPIPDNSFLGPPDIPPDINPRFVLDNFEANFSDSEPGLSASFDSLSSNNLDRCGSSSNDQVYLSSQNTSPIIYPLLDSNDVNNKAQKPQMPSSLEGIYQNPEPIAITKIKNVSSPVLGSGPTRGVSFKTVNRRKRAHSLEGPSNLLTAIFPAKKKHKCEHCPTHRSLTKRDLERHQRSKHPDLFPDFVPIPCKVPGCDRGEGGKKGPFKRKDHMQSHMRAKHHKTEVQTDTDYDMPSMSIGPPALLTTAPPSIATEVPISVTVQFHPDTRCPPGCMSLGIVSLAQLVDCGTQTSTLDRFLQYAHSRFSEVNWRSGLWYFAVLEDGVVQGRIEDEEGWDFAVFRCRVSGKGELRVAICKKDEEKKEG